MKKLFSLALFVPLLTGAAVFDPLVSTKTLSNYTHNVFLQGNLVLGGSTNVAEAISDLASRQFLPAAEQFGAVADGNTDCYEAITNCLGTYGEVYFRPGTYVISKAIRTDSHQKLLGAGKLLTTIKLQDGSADYNARPAGSKYDGVISYTVNAVGTIIRDLTVDANYANQTTGTGVNASNTICGIVLNGTGHQVVNCRVINIGSGVTDHTLDYQECFGINVSGFSADTGDTTPNLLLENEVTLTQDFVGGLGDYTCIVSFSDGGGTIFARNYVHDIPTASLVPNNLIAFGAMGSASIVTENTTKNFLGRGIFADTWTNSNIKIIGNNLAGTVHGIYMAGVAHWTNISIIGNTWENPLNIPAGSYPTTTVDVDTYQYPSAVLIRNAAKIDTLDIRGNTFVGRQWNDKGTPGQDCAAFIVMYPSVSSVWTNITVADNLMSHHATTQTTSDFTYGGWWLNDNLAYQPDVVRWSNNRNSAGTLQPFQARGWVSGVLASLEDHTFRIMCQRTPLSVPTNTLQLWSDLTTYDLKSMRDNGETRIFATYTNGITPPTFDIMVLTLGGGSNLLQFSKGILTNQTQFP